MKERKRNRLPEFDYSSSWYYFVTICVDGMKNILGEVKNGKITLNKYGSLINDCLLKIPGIYKKVRIDEYVIMPNHIHVILVVEENDLCTSKDRTKMGLCKIIQQFKRACTVQLIKEYGLTTRLWQRSFYDRIIRNEKELYQIRKYIHDNPLRWECDKNMIANLEL
jgi:REP element-mobilizing transposase RayT